MQCLVTKTSCHIITNSVLFPTSLRVQADYTLKKTSVRTRRHAFMSRRPVYATDQWLAAGACTWLRAAPYRQCRRRLKTTHGQWTHTSLPAAPYWTSCETLLFTI